MNENWINIFNIKNIIYYLLEKPPALRSSKLFLFNEIK